MGRAVSSPSRRAGGNVTAWLFFRWRDHRHGRAPWPGPHRGPAGRAGGPHARGARAGPSAGGYGSAALFLISLVSRPSRGADGAWAPWRPRTSGTRGPGWIPGRGRHFARRAASRRRSSSTTATSYGPPTPPSSRAWACSRLHSAPRARRPRPAAPAATDTSARARQIRESRHACVSAIVLAFLRHPAAARPCWPGSSGTVRTRAAVGRHPKVPAGWNVAARRSVTRRCYLAGWGAVSGDQAQLAGPGRRPRCGWRRRACPGCGSHAF